MVKRLLIGAVRGYQRAISPLKRAPTCRFIPSCSDYMADAIEQRGVLVGLAKGVWRILRCQPFGGHGYDPVAPRALSDGERQH